MVHRIEDYIEKYCSKSLREIVLSGNSNFLFKDLSNSFVNVEIMGLHGMQYDVLTNEIPFITNFPNLNSLDVVKFPKNFSIRIAFPYLKYLRIEVDKSHEDIRNNVHHHEYEISEFLKLNPQLEKLRIHSYFCELHPIIFRDVHLPMLKCLILFYPLSQNSYSVERFHFENVIYLEMWPSRVTHIPFTFNKLEKFKCRSMFRTIPPCICDFIIENQHLKSIKLRLVTQGGVNELPQLFETCSTLTNIEKLNFAINIRLSSISLISDDIRNLFSRNKSLKVLALRVSRNEDGSTDLRDSFVKSKVSKQKPVANAIKLTLIP